MLNAPLSHPLPPYPSGQLYANCVRFGCRNFSSSRPQGRHRRPQSAVGRKAEGLHVEDGGEKQTKESREFGTWLGVNMFGRSSQSSSVCLFLMSSVFDERTPSFPWHAFDELTVLCLLFPCLAIIFRRSISDCYGVCRNRLVMAHRDDGREPPSTCRTWKASLPRTNSRA